MSFFSNIFRQLTTHTSPVSTLSMAFFALPIATLILTSSGEIVEVNQKVLTLFGYESKDLIGENMSLFKSGKHDSLFYKNLWEKLTKSEVHSFEIYNRCKDGRILLFKEQVQLVKDISGDYFIITLEDITQQKKQESRQLHLATHDPLTGLANRALLHDRYQHAVLNAKRNHSKLGVMICDLNEFKQINDECGHTFGDEVLKSVASRLEDFVRESDTVSRYGGDEFIIIFEQFNNSTVVADMYKSLMKKLNFSMTYNGVECDVSASLGYACFPEEGTTFEQLVNVADMKMYNAKKCYYGC